VLSSRDHVVGILSRVLAGRQRNRGPIFGSAKDFVSKTTQAECGTHLCSYFVPEWHSEVLWMSYSEAA
jgi:hypothetical protein